MIGRPVRWDWPASWLTGLYSNRISRNMEYYYLYYIYHYCIIIIIMLIFDSFHSWRQFDQKIT